MDLYRDYHCNQNTIIIYNRASTKVNKYLNNKDYHNQVKTEYFHNLRSSILVLMQTIREDSIEYLNYWYD